jgi:hypothetical protein
MKRSFFARFFGFLGLYLLIFLVVASVQFPKRDGFSLRISHFTAEGRYRAPEEGEELPRAGSSPVEGEVRVAYGGLEFIMGGDSSGGEGSFRLLDTEGEGLGLSAEYMAPEEQGLRFYLSGGAQILFVSPADGSELRITGDFDEEAFSGLELPYRLLRSSWIPEGGQFRISAGGREYQFRGPGAGDRTLVLPRGGLPVVYGLADKSREWKAEDYILAGGAAEAYREALDQWAGQNYALWGRLIPSGNEEDMVTAYEGEALRRGAYRNALNVVPGNFLSSPGRNYEASVYLGGISSAYRSLRGAEGENLARITEILERGSPAFFLESHVIEFLDIRGRENLIDQGIGLIQDANPAFLAPEHIPGLLEIRVELGRCRPQVFGAANPSPFLEVLTAQAELILSECLRRLPPMEHYPIGLVLAVREGRADLAWNLRLGKALADWGEFTGRETWAAIGRSIVLSVLSLEDREGQVISVLSLEETPSAGGAQGAETPARISAARLYRLLGLGDYSPRARALSPSFPGLWAWTASPEIRVTREGQVLDIALSFPAGESHYLFIRGIEPFYRLQFYGMDWRTDPNFERYDSSGWAYYSEDRTLVLKVKHRAEIEHIRLYTGSPPEG